MKRSIKVTRVITEALQSLQKLFIELKRQKQQLPITMFFHKFEKIVCTIEDPQPSSSAPDVILQSSFLSDQPYPPSADDPDDRSPVSSGHQLSASSQCLHHNPTSSRRRHCAVISPSPSSSVIIAATRIMEKSVNTHNRLRYFLTNKLFLLQVVYRYVRMVFFLKLTKQFFSLLCSALIEKHAFFIDLSFLETVHVQCRYCVFSLLSRLMRIRLKRQNSLFSYERESFTANYNVMCSTLYYQFI